MKLIAVIHAERFESEALAQMNHSDGSPKQKHSNRSAFCFAIGESKGGTENSPADCFPAVALMKLIAVTHTARFESEALAQRNRSDMSPQPLKTYIFSFFNNTKVRPLDFYNVKRHTTVITFGYVPSCFSQQI